MGVSLGDEMRAEKIWEKIGVDEKLEILRNINFTNHISDKRDLSTSVFGNLLTQIGKSEEDFEELVNLLNERG